MKTIKKFILAVLLISIATVCFATIKFNNVDSYIKKFYKTGSFIIVDYPDLEADYSKYGADSEIHGEMEPDWIKHQRYYYIPKTSINYIEVYETHLNILFNPKGELNISYDKNTIKIDESGNIFISRDNP